MRSDSNRPSRLPPNQQLVAPAKWPFVGERRPGHGPELWTITVKGLVVTTKTWSLDQLATLPQTRMQLDIHCVTRWSKFDMVFSGVLLGDLLGGCELRPEAQFVSFVARSERKHSSSLPVGEALSLDTLIATHVNSQPLPVEHGGPVRGIVPKKYFYKSVKWLEQIELLEHDRLGYWEAEAGYHNAADPWLQQRFVAPSISKRRAAELIESRDFRSGDLRGIDASGRSLDQLQAKEALLRDANFNDCSLHEADFRHANLSGARFRRARLSGADFSGADVEGADFAGADLRGVNFNGCSLFGASFCEVSDEDSPGDSMGRWDNPAVMDQTTRLDARQIEVLTDQQAALVRDRVFNRKSSTGSEKENPQGP